MKRTPIGPQTFEAAKLLADSKPVKPRQALARGKGIGQGQAISRSLGPKQTRVGCARARLKAALDSELAAWGRKVKKRDGNLCQWAGCEFCHNLPGVTLDPHHKALRSARHDLRLVLDNGVAVCRRRHDWIHSPAGHDEAVRLGFLNPRSRELAAKEGSLGIR